MDDRAFDALARLVAQPAARRRALRALLGGAVAAALTRLGAGEGGAACTDRRRRCSQAGECCGYPGGNVACARLPRACDRGGDRCCGRTGARCGADCDCCRGFACGAGGYCRANDDGGRGCGGATCANGWSCCRFDGVARCIDPDYLRCCRAGICQRGWDCCGQDGKCCEPGWKCCGRGRCCPDGWRCGETACFASRQGDVATRSAETVPFAVPATADEQDWISKGWMTGGPEGEPTPGR